MPSLHCLTTPDHYYERDLQRAIARLWSCLFDQYYPVNPRTLKMPKEWRPDLVAEREEENGYLIIELKITSGNGAREAAIKQVVGYAKRFHEVYPHIPLKLMVIGPYHKQSKAVEIEKCDGYEVAVVQLTGVGFYLSDLAEEIMLWHARNPLVYKPKQFQILEDIVLSLAAYVGDEIDDSETQTEQPLQEPESG